MDSNNKFSYGMNKSVVLGQVESDVKPTRLENNTCIANYTLLVPKKSIEGTDRVKCTAFGKAAQFAINHIESGDMVLVVGHLQSNEYVNKNRERVYTTELIVETQEINKKQAG